MIDETVAEIREMQTHSSSVVAVKATRALEELVDREYVTLEEFDRDLEHNAGVLRRANPSHASLHRAMRDIVDRVAGETASVAEARELLASVVDDVAERIQAGKREAAATAAETFVDGETVFTHDYSSTVLEAMETAVSEGVDLTVYVSEARPRYLGRKTARRLAGMDPVDAHLLVDAAAGHVLGDCDRVVLGMDCIVGDSYYNRVGTFPVVAAADRLGVPVDVVGSGTKVVADGFRFENEFRPPSEVMREPVEDIEIENPAYDATPVDLVDRVVTDQGVREPEAIRE
ncbi:translation initiation factor eIF-2B [Halobaculum sp. MBLA0143]|uniref:translation initiation factor eIF-2B n=1 Tax=Halobaculum sp. MBLA0143 TaxID=3079933 RepID=UPI003523B776